jgi:hypothetical protein
MFLLAFYYNSYRYPFQINSTETSAVYRDTPLGLVFGKYLLAAAIMACAVIFGAFPLSRMKVRKPIYLAVYAYLAVIPITHGLMAKDVQLVESGVFFFVPMVFHLLEKKSISCRMINSLIRYALFIAIGVDIIQIALFFLVGRLPALAWPGSMSVRFGSFLDDPNGFGVLIALFAGFAIAGYSGWKRAALICALSVCLLASQSLTALLVVPVAALLCALTFMISQPKSILRGMLISVSAVALIAVVTYPYHQAIIDLLQVIGSEKSLSIMGHARSLDVLASKGLIDYLGFNPTGYTGESGYVNLAANFGIVYVLIYLGIGLVTIFKCCRRLADSAASPSMRAFAGAAFCFLIAAYATTINLPLEEVFPINLLTVLIIGLVSSNAIHADEPSSRNAAPHIDSHSIDP